MKTVLQGIAIGVANIIPGVSGGTVAVILGIYDRLIESISDFWGRKERRKEYIIFLSQICCGVAFGVLVFAKLLHYCLQFYPQPTAFFFTGLIVGGIPAVYKAHKNMEPDANKIIFFVLAFFIITAVSFFPQNKELILRAVPEISIGLCVFLFVSGFIAAGTMVIPGISGSLMLIIIGSYGMIISSVSALVSSLYNFKNGFITGISSLELWYNVLLISVVCCGALSGVLLFTKMVNYFLKNYPGITYYAILGLIAGSVLEIFPGITFNLTGLISVFTCLTGYLLARRAGS